MSAVRRAIYLSHRLWDRAGHEWQTLEDLADASARRGSAAALALIAVIAALDFSLPYTNVSVLYVVPLAVLAFTGALKHPLPWVSLLVALTLAIYVVKYALVPGDLAERYWNYRLVNRTMTVVMLIVIGRALVAWIRWRREQSDRELPDTFRDQEQDVKATMSLVCCIPLAAVIAAIDFVTPANYNLTILYAIPLFICAWVQSRSVLWAMFAILLLLSVAGVLLGPPVAESDAANSMLRNRMLASAGMAALALVLSYWLSTSDRDS